MVAKEQDIAVVGMSCIFPGARDLAGYWENIISKTSAIKLAPENRIPGFYYDPDSSAFDRHSVNMGGFIDEFLEFDPIEFGMVPKALQGTEPDQLIALKLTKMALVDAGVIDEVSLLEKTGIVIAKGNFGGIEMLKVNDIVVGSQNLLNLLSTIFPSLEEHELDDIKKKFQDQLGKFNSQNIMGTVPNLVASLVANRFNFGGPAYTLDAACAGSLLAIESAVRELHSGRCDMVVAGAVHLAQTPGMFSFFDTLGALSKSQVIRPFDKNADGVLTGEGCGFVVLKRLSDAIKDENRVYAVIKGIGVSSDGNSASVMSPSTVGQVKAIKRAWAMAGLDTSDVGYVEAHGTGTVLGDKTELATLKEAFPHKEGSVKAGLGAVKAMTGHAMAAAGMAGFIKTVLALHKGIIPPTINCTDPLDEMENTHFRPIDAPMNWKETGLPMLAGVNAFGFGGANAHVVLGHHPTSSLAKIMPNHADEAILLARSSTAELIHAINNRDYSLGNGSCRIVIFNPTEERLALAIRILEKDIVWHGRQDIWYSNAPLLNDPNAKVAVLFPGMDMPAIQSLNTEDITHFVNYFAHDIRAGLELNENSDRARVLENFQHLIYASLQTLGVEPDAVAGHSLGEWTAASAIGMVDPTSIEKVNAKITSKTYEPIDAVFLSVSCSLDTVSLHIKDEPDVYISNDNCHQQVVLSARTEIALKLKEKLVSHGIVSHILPFNTGYHSPFAEVHAADAREHIENILKFSLPTTPIWSAISARPYPGSIEQIKQLNFEFITKPVRFREMIENMYKDGFRFFIQIGNGALTGFVQNILQGRNTCIVASGSSKRKTANQTMRVLAALFVEGREVNISHFRAVKAAAKKNITQPRKGLPSKVNVNYEYMDFSKVFSADILRKMKSNTQMQQLPEQVHRTAIMDALKSNLNQINDAQNAFLSSLDTASFRSNTSMAARRDVSRTIEISTETFPHLLDHCPFAKRAISDDFSHQDTPIVPFTMFVDLVCEFFMASFPGLPLVGMSDVHVKQFLWVKEPIKVELKGVWLNNNHIRIAVDNVFEAVLSTAPGYPNPDVFVPMAGAELAIPAIAEEVYNRGYMFHGPDFQGLKRIERFTEQYLETTIRGLSASGAMLDNMGQTVGLFYHFLGKSLRSFPVAVKNIEFFQSPVEKWGDFTCRCYTEKEDDDFLYTRIELFRDNQLWCRFRDWKTKKSDLDHEGWLLISQAEGRALSRYLTDDIFIIEKDRFRQANTWQIFANIYLSTEELAFYDALSVAKQKDYLLGRIAAKDAIRNSLLKMNSVVSHPASYKIINNGDGKPEVYASKFATVPNISIAHKHGFAIAKSSFDNPVGVDIEKLEAKGPGFIDMVVNKEEKLLLSAQFSDDECAIRAWAAKEAYGKRLGKGLQGDARNYIIKSIKGENILIQDVTVRTMKHMGFIIAWTL